MSKQCRVCFEIATMTCQYCQQISYCSSEHQLFDWYQHKQKCFQFKEFYSTPDNSDVFSKKSKSKKQNSTDNEFSGSSAQHQMHGAIQRDKLKIQQSKITALKYKALLEQRQQERNTTLFNNIKQQGEKCLINGKRLVLTSSKVLTQWKDQLQNQLRYHFRIRTNRFLQQVELLFDCSILMKIYQRMQKKEQLNALLPIIKYPTVKPCPVTLTKQSVKQDLIKYNEWRQEVSKYQGVLKCIITIMMQTNFVEKTEALLSLYQKLIKDNYGPCELATTYFEQGNWFMKINNLKKAMIQFTKCMQIREKYGQRINLCDIYMNMGLLQYSLNKDSKRQAIQFIEKSLQIKRDKLKSFSEELCPQLQTLGKFQLQSGNFQNSFKRLTQCWQIRKKHCQNKKDNRKIRAEVLLMTLYTNMKRFSRQSRQIAQRNQLDQLIIKMQNQLFSKNDFDYYDLKSIGQGNEFLKLQMSSRLFNMFTPKEIQDYGYLTKILQKLSLHQGVNHVKKSDFYNALRDEKRNLFESLNPVLININSITQQSA